MKTDTLNQRTADKNASWRQKVAPAARKFAVAAAAVVALGLAACGGDEQERPAAAPTPAAQSAPANAPDGGLAEIADGGAKVSSAEGDAGAAAEKAAPTSPPPTKSAPLSGNLTKHDEREETKEGGKRLKLVFVPASHGYALNKQPGSAARFLSAVGELTKAERTRQQMANTKATAAGGAPPYPNFDSWEPTEAVLRSPGWVRALVKAGVLVEKTRAMYMERYNLTKENSGFVATHKDVVVRTKSMPGGQMTLDDLLSRMTNKGSPRSPQFLDASVAGRADSLVKSLREKAISLAVEGQQETNDFTVFDSGIMQKAVEEVLPEAVKSGTLTDRSVAFNRWLKLQTISHFAENLEPEFLDKVLENDTLRGFLLRYAPSPTKTAPVEGQEETPDATTRGYDLVIPRVNQFVEVLVGEIPPTGTLDLDDPTQVEEIERFASNPANGYLTKVRTVETPAGNDTKTAPADATATATPTKVGGLVEFLDGMDIPPTKHADVQDTLILALMTKAARGKVQTGRDQQGKAVYEQRFDYGQKSVKQWAAERGLEFDVETTTVGGEEVQKLKSIRSVEKRTKRQNQALATEIKGIVAILDLE